MAAIVLALAAIVYLAGNASIPLTDRDEGCYAQVSRTMLQTGDWVVPRFRDQVFDGKPVFAFWCQAVAMKIFGQTPFAARFPSVVFGLATLALVWWTTHRFIGPRRAVWTLFILATSGLFTGLSKLAMTDGELLFFITLAQICLAAIYLGRKSPWIALFFWLAVALAMLTKGPVVIGVLGGTVFTLALLDLGREIVSPRAWLRATRWWWSTRLWMALIILPLVLGPWAILMGQRAPGFFRVTIIQYMLGPIFSKALEGRSLMPGFYLGVIWPSIWPWTLLLPMALWRGWKNRRFPAVRICLAAFVGPFVVDELVKQKLPHYLLPLFPPLAFLLADCVVRILRDPMRLTRNVHWQRGLLAWFIAAIALAMLPWIFVIPRFALPDFPYGPILAFTLTGLLCAAVVAAFLFKGQFRTGFLLAGITIAGVYLLGFVFVIPAFTPLQATRRVGEAIYRSGFHPGDTVALLDFQEPSLTFYLDGAGTPHANAYLNKTAPEDWPRWFVMTGKHWAELPDRQRRLLRVLGIYPSFSFGSAAGPEEIVVVEKQP